MPGTAKKAGTRLSSQLRISASAASSPKRAIILPLDFPFTRSAPYPATASRPSSSVPVISTTTRWGRQTMESPA